MGHPHYLYQALRRGSPEMGEEDLTAPGPTPKVMRSRIHDYASEIVGAVADRLGAGSIVRGPYQAILCIRQMALVTNGVDRAPARGVDLLRDDVLGASLFWQPVAGPAATLEEWLRYPPGERKNLVERRGLEGDLVLQTANTTVIAMPGKPSFLITAYEEGAEFTATLRAQLKNWRRQVAKCNDAAKGTFNGSDQQWNKMRNELETGQATLRRIRRQVQSELALVKSSGLCKTPVNREYLDDLWTETGLKREEYDLQEGITQAKALYDDMVAALANLEAQRDQRWQARVDYVVAIIAIAGIADLCALVNALPVGQPGVVVELSLIAILAVVLAGVLRRERRTR
jgi:hypothetical protein